MKDEWNDDPVEKALRHFRESVQAWSEAEHGQRKALQSSKPRSAIWRAISAPAIGWALAAALVTSGVGIPWSVAHERRIAAQQAEQVREMQRREADEARRKAAPAVSDDELLSHVDSDIAQAAPDAMEPLASLMDENGK